MTNTKSEIIFDVSRFLLPSTVSLRPFEATSPEGDGVVNLVTWGCLMMIITCGRYSVCGGGGDIIIIIYYYVV